MHTHACTQLQTKAVSRNQLSATLWPVCDWQINNKGIGDGMGINLVKILGNWEGIIDYF